MSKTETVNEQTKGRNMNLFLLVFGCLFVLGSIGIIKNSLVPELLRYDAFQQALKLPVERVNRVQLVESKGDDITYYLDIEYEYKVNHQAYASHYASLYREPDYFKGFYQHLLQKVQDFQHGGKPLYCYVLPDKLDEAVLDRSFRPELFALEIILILFFFSVGSAFVYQGIRGKESATIAS